MEQQQRFDHNAVDSATSTTTTKDTVDGEEDPMTEVQRGISHNEATTSTTASTTSSLDEEGEILQLLNSIEDETSPILTDHVFEILKREPSLNRLPSRRDESSYRYTIHAPDTSAYSTEDIWYGHTLTEENALEAISKQAMLPGDIQNDEPSNNTKNSSCGIIWYVTLIPDNFFADGKLKKGLNQKDFDIVHGTIKPRRASLPVTVSQLFSSITKVPIQSNQVGKLRYIFNGLMNGWPALRTMELLTLEERLSHTTVIPKAKELLTGQFQGWKTWEAMIERDKESSDGAAADPLKAIKPDRVYRAKLRCPPWTASGWSSQSPGFCFWYEPQHQNRLSYGTGMLQTVETDPICTHVHMIAHRYAVKGRESPRDRLTYHTVCLLEWDHGKYCTVLELAFLNGLGGYKGQTNWYHDRDDPITGLYQAFPPEMIMPWKTNQGEIRCFDLPHVKSLGDFKQYLDTYRNTRFIDPRVAFSHAARLTFRSKPAIAQYLLNYCQRDSSYAELKRNCQTFAADFSCFLAGKKGVQPFHPVSRIEYQNRTYLFLYDAHLYDT